MMNPMKMKIPILHLHLSHEGEPPSYPLSPSPDQTIPPPPFGKVLDSGKTRQAYADLPRPMTTTEPDETAYRIERARGSVAPR